MRPGLEGLDFERLFWVNPRSAPGTNWHIALAYRTSGNDTFSGRSKTLCTSSMTAVPGVFDPTWDHHSPTLICSKCMRKAATYVRSDQADHLHVAGDILHGLFPIEAVIPTE